MSHTRSDGPGREATAQPCGDDEAGAFMAEQLGRGFLRHDQRKRDEAVEAFGNVDALQFPHLDERTAREAATAYVDALWAKDATEGACRVDGEIDPERLAAADWSDVEAAFARRAEVAGIDPGTPN